MPVITPLTIQILLNIISGSMLSVATFAVGSMISAFASVASSATPRAFALIITDDKSKSALSCFMGSFIFSVVAIVALNSGLYDQSGLFILFVETLAVFAWIVLTFVRWVDSIARLGRLGPTIDKVESEARDVLEKRRAVPYLGGVQKTFSNTISGDAVFLDRIGYVQHIDMSALQTIAQSYDYDIMVAAMPGTFLAPGRCAAIVGQQDIPDHIRSKVERAFVIGDNRTYDGDPRFGLIVLSEIAARALSPAVNDPGTAIIIIVRLVRLFACYTAPKTAAERNYKPKYNRVIVPDLSLRAMFGDAFTSIARDGAGCVEVGIRLQKALLSLSCIDYPRMWEESVRMSDLALERAKVALTLQDDIDRLERFRECFVASDISNKDLRTSVMFMRRTSTHSTDEPTAPVRRNATTAVEELEP